MIIELVVELCPSCADHGIHSDAQKLCGVSLWFLNQDEFHPGFGSGLGDDFEQFSEALSEMFCHDSGNSHHQRSADGNDELCDHL
jgi:hypothetical protein